MKVSEQSPPDHAAPLENLGPTGSDKLFILFVIVVLVCVGWVGQLTYREGKKTEVAKANVETWSKWLTEASPLRAKPGFQPAACAIPVPDATPAAKNAAPAVAANPVLWGDCLKALTAPEGPLGGLRNAFTGALPAIVAKCDPADRSHAGALVLEKSVPAPIGSAIPMVISPLVETDAIDHKVQIRVSACDGGAYPTKLIELEF